MRKPCGLEQAGLGKAPYRFVDVAHYSGPTIPGVPPEQVTDRPKPVCQACAKKKAPCLRVCDDEGRYFQFCLACATKSGDASLKRSAKEHRGQKRRVETRDRSEYKTYVRSKLERAFREGKCAALHKMPHPKGWFGKTAYDYVAWCMDKPGAMGDTAYRLMAEAVWAPNAS